VTTTKIDMIRQLELLSESCHRSDVQADLIPIREIGPEELANTLHASEMPEHSGYYSLPLLNTDGTRTGGFGYISSIVDVYRDGTAIARTREWKYAYREDEPTPDGRRVRRRPGANRMVVRFYLLGCRHEYEERPWEAAKKGITLYSHDHYHVCKNCGHSYLVDSSG
jgi:hypothetical protein